MRGGRNGSRMGLRGRVAIVTGAARGLGRDYADMFAKDGVKVVIADVMSDRASVAAESIRQRGGEAIAVKSDVSDLASVTAMASAAHAAFGRVAILVHNAAS